MRDPTPPPAPTAPPSVARPLVKHALAGLLPGLVVFGLAGGAVGFGHAWDHLMHLGSSGDSALYFVMFGPFEVGIAVLIGACIGGALGALVGAGVGLGFGAAQVATAARGDLWSRPVVWYVLQLVALVALAALALDHAAFCERLALSLLR